MELEAFVNWIGMTPHQAIVSATSAAATLLGVADSLGTLAPGKGADFIVLDANPLDDIRNTRRISDVYLRGKKINREAMAARWKAACGGGRAVGTSGQAATEPLSKTYRVTRADDVEFQKIEPFKVFDNLDHVGPGYVSVWLLTTPEGNILFDSAQEPYVDYVISNIRKVGVDPKSIRYIILSHGHLDHFGGAAKIQEASGARVVAAEEDWKLIEQVGSRPGRGGAAPPRVPKRDMVVKDGESLTVGGQTLKFHITPGHTPGVVTTEGITLYDGGKPYQSDRLGRSGLPRRARRSETVGLECQQGCANSRCAGEPADPQLGRARRVSARWRARARPDAEVPQTWRSTPIRGSGHVYAMGQAGSGQRREGRSGGNAKSRTVI